MPTFHTWLNVTIHSFSAVINGNWEEPGARPFRCEMSKHVLFLVLCVVAGQTNPLDAPHPHQYASFTITKSSAARPCQIGRN